MSRRTRGQGGAVSGTCEGEFMNLSPQWLGAKVFCKIEAEEWRTCDVGKRCTPGAWFKIRVEDLLQPTAKIVRRKDGVLGYRK